MLRIRILYLTHAILLIAGLRLFSEMPRVAVLPFNALEVSKSDSVGIALLFETALQNTLAFDVIEQTRAEAILEAQEYSLSECTDEFCAVEIGKLLSAEQIVIGTVGKIGKIYYVNIKVIDVKTGRNLGAQKASAESVEFLVFKLEAMATAFANSLSYVKSPPVPIGRSEQLPENTVPQSNDPLQADVATEYQLISSRFLDNGDGTVTDHQANLMWTKRPASLSANFNESRKYCQDLEISRYSDWRLPTKSELDSLYKSLSRNPNRSDAQVEPFKWNNESRYWAATLKIFALDFQTGDILEIDYQRGCEEKYSARAVRSLK